ncbi:MAG TPA: hypothetical protein VFN71_05455 [Methylomirabilota bacterium]|nr:hypothetical protein [Methylomirabilota bacterium]
MTNTLHRYSDHYGMGDRRAAEPVTNDFIVFAMAARGINDDDVVRKYRTFAELALRHNPVNIGDATKGGIYRPDQNMKPISHWVRDTRPHPEQVVEEIDGPTTMSAVFRRAEDMEAFVRDLRDADLGVSINISAPMDAARRCCEAAGIRRHSVEYSLGFQGRLDRLPDRTTLEIDTMCGHGMVSHHLVKKLSDWVKEGRRTPDEAARYLARFCTCGVFNAPRAAELFERARSGKS